MKRREGITIKKRGVSHTNPAMEISAPDFFPEQQSAAVCSAILGHPLVPGYAHTCVRAYTHGRSPLRVQPYE